MFAFDLPFILICGIILGYLNKTTKITQNANWILGLCILFIFQSGGLLLWMEIFSGSKEFMIIPFQILGMTTSDFEPFLVAILFGIEPFLMFVGEIIGLKYLKYIK